LQKVNKGLSDVSTTTQALQDGTAHLATLLTEASTNLSTILSGCPSDIGVCNDTRDAAVSALKLGADFSAVREASCIVVIVLSEQFHTIYM